MAGSTVTRRATLFAAAAASAAPALARAGDGWEAVDAAARHMVAQRMTPGVQLAVMRKGRLAYSRAFGAANLETATPMSAQSVCRVASLTKSFTAAAMLRLQEEGVLSLDDRLSRFLPDFPRAGDISLRQLLNHTSGLGDYSHTDPPELVLQRSRQDYRGAALVEMLRSHTAPLFIGEPGRQFAYSNTAYVLLGPVIEKAAGKPLDDAMRELVFARAGLIRTAVDDAAEVVPGRASGYSADAKAPTGFQNASFISMTYPGAAAAVRSTAEDFCRWSHSLFGGRVVKPESLKALTTPVRLPDGSLPTTPGGAPLVAPPRLTRWGLGVYVDSDEHGSLISHRGGIQGFISYAENRPEAGVHLAMTVNVDGGSALGAGVRALHQALLAAALA
jgi:CubicO group peptidase (beta-lactamase class C family)